MGDFVGVFDFGKLGQVYESIENIILARTCPAPPAFRLPLSPPITKPLKTLNEMRFLKVENCGDFVGAVAHPLAPERREP